MSGRKGMQHYSVEVKREAVRLVVEEHLMYADKKISHRIAGSVSRAAQYRAIYHYKEEFEVKSMCEFFGVSRAAYYKWIKKLEEADPDRKRIDQIQTVYEASHKTYGYRRITIQLQQKQGVLINHKTVL